MDDSLSDQQIDAYIQECTIEYGLQLYKFALRLTSDRDDANDLVQDALERGYHHLRKTRHPFDSILGWFHTVLQNEYYDILRARKRHVTDSIEVLQFNSFEDTHTLLREVFIDTSDQPEIVVERKLILEQTMMEIQNLPPGGIRNALMLCSEGVNSPREIATLANQTYSSARSNISRGRKLLRTRLVAWTGEEQEA